MTATESTGKVSLPADAQGTTALQPRSQASTALATTVLLTGATGSIGSATAALLLAYNYRVLLTDRDQTRLLALTQQLGGNASCVVADIRVTDDCRRLAQAAEEHGVSIVIHNAAVSYFDLLENSGISEIELQLRTNLVSPLILTHLLLPRLKTLPEAHLLFIGSPQARQPQAGHAAYAASKAGLRTLSQALRRELADTGICVSYLSPAPTDTGLHGKAHRRWLAAQAIAPQTPDAVAEAIAWVLYRKRGVDRQLGWKTRFRLWLQGSLLARLSRPTAPISVLEHTLNTPPEDRTGNTATP